MPPMTSRRRLAVLATVCLAVFAINLDTTIVNVALPDLARQLSASTRDLQWVVDGYNLAFAALVLTAGSVGDRFGRRPVLLGGLVGFALASGVGALCTDAGALVVVRIIMGAFAALIFPTTLSIITNIYPDRSERAKAIGVWGAVTGLGVAVGPVTGGVLLAHFWWGSVFIALVPVALIAAALAFVLVPESRDPSSARMDLPGLVSSSAAIGLLVYTIIEAPSRGWGSSWTLIGFAATALLVATFIAIERRHPNPMLDVTLFRTPAFSAASGAVTVAFFALFGFIFLITQYFQFIRGYGTLSTGVRILPVALTIAIGSVAGARLAGRLGTRVIVVTGLVLFGTAFAWIAISPTFMSYSVIVAQMVLMGTGLGLTTAPATESILSVLPPAKAGVGSAVQRRHPRGRWHARRRHHRQRLHLHLRPPPGGHVDRGVAAPRGPGRQGLGGRGDFGGHWHAWRDRAPADRRRERVVHERAARCLPGCRRCLLARCRGRARAPRATRARSPDPTVGRRYRPRAGVRWLTSQDEPGANRSHPARFRPNLKRS
jgi:EmrB/QacA subfamily drug resistance transporter